MIDFSGDFGARAARRLDEEIVIWLTTVRADGAPQPSPVWFLWADQELLIYSKPNAPKLRNIQGNPNVSLHFDGDGEGGDIVILAGQARIDEQAPSALEVTAYLEKYSEQITDIQMTPTSFARAYSTAIRVTPTKLRGF
jgi:PPOX class probable F420-dependent enzyme